MISTIEAFEKIMQCKVSFQIKEISIQEAQGKRLAEDIFSDRDFPSFHRVCMDGIAIQYQDPSIQSFHCIGIQAAGEPPQTLKDSKQCIEIMTGAVLPHNANTIIPYEHLIKKIQNDEVFFEAKESFIQGQHIHKKGIDHKQGNLLLSKNTFIRGIEIGILASVGKSKVKVFEYPEILLVSTGDELVGIEKTPLPYQVRESNVYALRAILQSIGISTTIVHLDDDKKKIQEFVDEQKLKYSIMIFSGGISAGKFDFLPKVLKEKGLDIRFHKIAQKPGKPMLFGVFDNEHIVFSLPGNPVSALVCMYRYILPWLKGMQMDKKIIIGEDILLKNQLTNFIPVSIKNNKAYPIKNNGSGDFISLSQAKGMVEIFPTKTKILSGEELTYWEFLL